MPQRNAGKCREEGNEENSQGWQAACACRRLRSLRRKPARALCSASFSTNGGRRGRPCQRSSVPLGPSNVETCEWVGRVAGLQSATTERGCGRYVKHEGAGACGRGLSRSLRRWHCERPIELAEHPQADGRARRARQWLDGSVLPEGGWVLQGVALTRLSAVLNALVMAGLVWAGALSFRRVVRSDSGQLVYCMQARARPQRPAPEQRARPPGSAPAPLGRPQCEAARPCAGQARGCLGPATGRREDIHAARLIAAHVCRGCGKPRPDSGRARHETRHDHHVVKKKTSMCAGSMRPPTQPRPRRASCSWA